MPGESGNGILSLDPFDEPRRRHYLLECLKARHGAPELDDEDLPAPDDFDRSGAQDRDWHPNTIKVVGLLRDQLDAAESLSFDAFTAGANKRSAVGVFVELLHLKTWDFVQLDQPAALETAMSP